jgi:hypothetical protein
MDMEAPQPSFPCKSFSEFHEFHKFHAFGNCNSTHLPRRYTGMAVMFFVGVL